MAKKHWIEQVPEELSCIFILFVIIFIVAIPIAIIKAIFQFIAGLF
ncbi:hypothetical protein [Streptomyces sp. NPDC058486]